MDCSGTETDKPADALPDDLIGLLEQGRLQFLALVEHVRPELHRYCARMTGSAADGREVLVVLTEINATRPRYFIQVVWVQGHVTAIRDFRYLPYIAQEDRFVLAEPGPFWRPS